MSTRSVIVFTGKAQNEICRMFELKNIMIDESKDTTVRVYRHCDGYPTANLDAIAHALLKADQPLENVVDEFLSVSGGRIDQTYDQEGKINGKSVFNEPVRPSHFGKQGDVEWTYLVDLENKLVNVWGRNRDWSIEDCPERMIQREMTPPTNYIYQLYDEYQDKEKASIEKSMRNIEELGFKINAKDFDEPKMSKLMKACLKVEECITWYEAKETHHAGEEQEASEELILEFTNLFEIYVEDFLYKKARHDEYLHLIKYLAKKI